MSQITSNPPVNRNEERQPKCAATIGTINGATTAPIFEPLLKMPVAKARSSFGNQSATVLMAAGKFDDSPSPRANRAAANCKGVLASECNIDAALHTATASA